MWALVDVLKDILATLKEIAEYMKPKSTNKKGDSTK